MSDKATSLVVRMAQRLGVDSQKLYESLTKVCFSVKEKDRPARAPEPEELLALLVICEQYQLNPFTRQIFAFLAKGGKVVPVVSVDGWIAILNRQPDYDGMEIEFSDKTVMAGGLELPEFCRVKIYRKGLSKPVSVSEFAQECFVEKSEVWRKFPRRMLRHKAIIQAVRVAFGICGIYDEDEAKNIINADAIEVPQASASIAEAPKPALLPSQTQEELQKIVTQLTRHAAAHPGGWSRAYQWADANLADEADRQYVFAALEKSCKEVESAKQAQSAPAAATTAVAVQANPDVFDDWDETQGV